MFARYYFRGREYGETQLLQFSTRLQSAHKLRVTTFQLRCLSNRSRMHGLIRKNASFLNHITFRYIYIYTHIRVENTLIILSQEVSLNYHNFFPSHPPLFLITDQPTDSIPFQSTPFSPLISRIKRSIPRIDIPRYSSSSRVRWRVLFLGEFLVVSLIEEPEIKRAHRCTIDWHLITSPRCNLAPLWRAKKLDE